MRGTKPYKPLLHDPLDPELAKLPTIFRRFKAQWSLREVEAEVPVMIRQMVAEGMDDK